MFLQYIVEVFNHWTEYRWRGIGWWKGINPQRHKVPKEIEGIWPNKVPKEIKGIFFRLPYEDHKFREEEIEQSMDLLSHVS